MTTRVPMILGCSTFGEAGTNNARIHTVKEVQEVVDVFVSIGQTGFDTSRRYGAGTSEEFLGKLDLHGGAVDTKIFPATPGAYARAPLLAGFSQSRAALREQKIRVLYLHAPDRSAERASFEDTLGVIDELFREGKIQEFGLSNFFSWEVAEFVAIAKRNGWIQPTVYQGRYNAVERGIEAELIPCLRKYGIKFFAYSPLAGGLLTGKMLTPESGKKLAYAPGSRWDPDSSPLAAWYIARYEPLLDVVRELKAVTEKHGIALSAVAQRWLQHHSALGPSDAVLMGVSSADQVKPNIEDCEGGPLPEDVVKLLDEAWEKGKGVAGYYAM